MPSSATLNANKRFVRNLRVKTDVDSDDEDVEERAGGPLSQVDDIADDINALVTTFKDWNTKTAGQILSSPSLRRQSSEKFMEKLNMWGLFNAMGEKAFKLKMKRIKLKQTAGTQRR